MNPLTDILTPKIRKTVYVAYALLGVAFGAVHIAYAQIPATPPSVLGVIEAVVLFLGGAFGLTAASNVSSNNARRALDADGDGEPDIAD